MSKTQFSALLSSKKSELSSNKSELRVPDLEALRQFARDTTVINPLGLLTQTLIKQCLMAQTHLIKRTVIYL